MCEADKRVQQLSRLVVIPSDPVAAYEAKGIGSRLETYYNPNNCFREVFALSPLESETREVYGMTVMKTSYAEFPNQLMRLQPSVIRAYGGFWPSDLACWGRIPSVPVLVSVHDTNPDLLHPSVAYADLVLCVSNAVAQKVAKIGTLPNRIRILPNRVDTSIFHPIAIGELTSLSQQFPSGKPILHVGRKTRQKNVDTVIRALQFLPSEYYAVFVGAGDRSQYTDLANMIGVENRCFWKESVPNAELPKWYSWAACLCVPSRWEGFGVVFIEAACCGTAIVSSNIPPINEFLTPDASACLVSNHENPRAMATAIEKVCTDRHYRQTIKSGAILAAQPFEKGRVDSAEVDIYHDAVRLAPRAMTQKDRLHFRLSSLVHRGLVRARRIRTKLSAPLLPNSIGAESSIS